MKLFHLHRWTFVSAQLVRVRFLGGAPGDATLVLQRCKGCRAVRTEELQGHWSRRDLEGAVR